MKLIYGPNRTVIQDTINPSAVKPIKQFLSALLVELDPQNPILPTSYVILDQNDPNWAVVAYVYETYSLKEVINHLADQHPELFNNLLNSGYFEFDEFDTDDDMGELMIHSLFANLQTKHPSVWNPLDSTLAVDVVIVPEHIEAV